MNSPQDTIAAIATPLGEGGLGVIRVSGHQAVSIVSGIFTNPALANAPSHSCHLGKLRGEQLIDQVVVALFRSPHSYTGEDVVEISAHGSPFTLRKILNLCLAKGARLAGPGEFTERAFLNGKMDLTQAEAVAELIRAKTDKSQAAALSQLQGSLSEKVRGLRDQIVPLLAHIEVGLDHSDEGHDFLPREKLIDQCEHVQQEIEKILGSARVSKILREGFRVAFLGRPNVGKSSLLNALLKEERAIVTPIPGTTRDTLEEGLNLKGIPVILTDTAGLRHQSTDPVELIGIERTHKSLVEADAVLAVFDGSKPFTLEDNEVMKACLAKPHIFVINKCDLYTSKYPFSPRRAGEGEDEGGNLAVQTAPLTQTLSHPLGGEGNIVHVSAKTGAGLDDLADTIAELALQEKANASEAQWLLNTRHQNALLRAKEALTHAEQSAREASYEECVALDLQTALAALGEVIGETTTEELLDQIFSQFCVGK
jgi:tRNA modification GTPase